MSEHDDVSFYHGSDNASQAMDIEEDVVLSPPADLAESVIEGRSREGSTVSDGVPLSQSGGVNSKRLRVDDVSPLCAFMRDVRNEIEVDNIPPVFCCPFWLREGRFPLLAKKLLWLLCDIHRMCEGKTKNVFLGGVPGTNVVEKDGIYSAMSYDVNRHMDLNGFNYMMTVDETRPNLKSIPAFEVQLRIVQAGRHEFNELFSNREQYLLVMVFSAPCFNLRTAVWEAVYARSNDPNLGDKTFTWHEILFHAKNFVKCYNESSMEVETADESTSLLLKETLTNLTNDCFTVLFSLPAALKSIVGHVSAMRSFDENLVWVEGFGAVGEQRAGLFEECINEIRNYELSWNSEMERYVAAKKKKRSQENTSGRQRNNRENDSVSDETVQNFRAKLPSSPVGIGTDGVLVYRIPHHALTVKFVCDVFMERTLSFDVFNRRWKGLPHSVNIVLLQRCLLRSRELDPSSVSEEDDMPAVVHGSEYVSQADWYRIVRGPSSRTKGSMFRQGFSGWQKFVESAVGQAPCSKRYKLLHDFMQQGVLLAIMHADGSDGCEFERLKILSLAMSDTKTPRFVTGRGVYREFVEKVHEEHKYVWDSHVSHALYFVHCMFGECNEKGFKLKEYNLFLLFLLCCRHAIGILDQSNGRVAPAPKCCGLMIWIRSGPFAKYDEKLKCVVDTYTKKNGTGLDTVIDLYRSIFALDNYSGYQGCGRLQLVPLDTTSAYGLKVECSDKYKSGSLVGTVNQFGQIYALTEMNIPDNNESLMFVGALVHIVKGSLSVEEASVTKSTVANPNGGERETYEWVLAVPFLAMIGAANLVGERCIERVRTLLCVSRALTASSGSNVKPHNGLLGTVNEKTGYSGFTGTDDRNLFKIYIDGVGVSLAVAYMQRQSIIDKVHASSVCSGLLEVFLSCLKRSSGILNPSYVSDLQFSRSVQTAQTYGVSLSLLIQSVDEILRDSIGGDHGFAGSDHNEYYRAVKNVALRFAACGLELPVLPCVMSDLTENMLRQDFFHLLGIFACELRVPCLSEDSLLSFFKSGTLPTAKEKAEFEKWILGLYSHGSIYTSERQPSQLFLSLPWKEQAATFGGRENVSPQQPQNPQNPQQPQRPQIIKSMFQSLIILGDDNHKSPMVRQVGNMIYSNYRMILEESCNMKTPGELINTLFNCVDTFVEFPKFYGKLDLFGNTSDLFKGDRLRVIRNLLKSTATEFGQESKDFAFHWIHRDKVWNLAVDFRWLLWWASVAGVAGFEFKPQSINATCTFRVVRSVVENFLLHFIPVSLFPAQVVPMGIPRSDTSHMMSIDFMDKTDFDRPYILQRPEQSFMSVIHGKFVGSSPYMSGLVEDVNCGERTLYWVKTAHLVSFVNVPVDLSPPPIPSDVWIPAFTVGHGAIVPSLTAVRLMSVDNTICIRSGGASERFSYHEFFAATGARLLPWLYRRDVLVRVEDTFCVIMEFKQTEDIVTEDLGRPVWARSQLFDPEGLCYYVSSVSSCYRKDAQFCLSPFEVVDRIVRVGTPMYVRCSSPDMDFVRSFLYDEKGAKIIPTEVNDSLILECYLAWDGNFVTANSFLGDGIETFEDYDDMAWVHVAANMLRYKISSFDEKSAVRSVVKEVITIRVQACYLIPCDVVNHDKTRFRILENLRRSE